MILPDASEITGIARDTSGLTVPVTLSSGDAARDVAVATGNCSGWSTLTRFESSSRSIFTGGGASEAASALTFSPQPVVKKLKDVNKSPASGIVRFIGLPLCPRPGSTGSRRLEKRPPGLNSSIEMYGSRFERLE